MAATSQGSILSDAMLERFAERAPGYDRDNKFFSEDFAELKQAGYLACAVPRELGGGGLTFAQVMREQRRLAYHAHATALGINMHVYWTGVAADLWRAGDKSLEWLLTGAVKGEVFAAGHAENATPRATKLQMHRCRHLCLRDPVVTSRRRRCSFGGNIMTQSMNAASRPMNFGKRWPLRETFLAARSEIQSRKTPHCGGAIFLPTITR